MSRLTAFALAGAGVAAAFALTAAQRPMALAPTEGGLWEVTGLPRSGPVRECVADTAVLAQFEHRGQTCTRLIISDGPETTVIHYTCAGGGFGRTKMTLITPRSLRIETQGISGGLPFSYVVQARHVGDCHPAGR